MKTKMVAILLSISMAGRAAAACPGDCDGNGMVGEGEVDAAVAVLLGRQAPGTCGAADADASGRVTVTDVVRAVGAVVGGCPAQDALVAGIVWDVDSRSPIAGAVVSAAGRATNSDSNGVFQLAGLAAGSIVVGFTRDGYAPGSEILAATTAGSPVAVYLKPVTARFKVDAAAGGTFQAGGSVLTLAAGSLVDGAGNAVTGEVELEIAKFAATGADVNAFPGGFNGMSAAGASTDIETFGFATYTLTSGGQPVDLAEGATAKIEFLIDDAQQGELSSGQQLGLWGYDEGTGQWVEEPTPGTVMESSQSPGKLAWVADVPHFSTWNCDRPVTEKHCFRGQVLSGGSPFVGALVLGIGVTYSGVSEDLTDQNGMFCIDVKNGETIRVEVRAAGSSDALTSRELTVPAVQASCETGGCTVLDPPLALTLDGCVSGIVRDAQGDPVPGVTVHVVPGETAVTGADGRYCAGVSRDSVITVFAPGYLSASLQTTGAGSCPAGCASIDLATPLEGAGFAVATASVSHFTSIVPDFLMFPPGYRAIENLDADGSFFILAPGSGPDPNTQVVEEEIGGCQVVTITSVFDGSVPPAAVNVLALDPGDPGMLTSGPASVNLLRGDPTSVNPPEPFLLGVYSPPEGSDLAALGFAAGQDMTFTWPGGVSIGPFMGTVGLPPEIVVTSPDLLDPSLQLVPGAPFATTWTPSGVPQGELVVTLQSVRQVFTPGTEMITLTTVTITCAFPDTAGMGTISSEATSRLAADGTSQSVTYMRRDLLLVPAERRQTGGTIDVSLSGSTSISRSILLGGGLGE